MIGLSPTVQVYVLFSSEVQHVLEYLLPCLTVCISNIVGPSVVTVGIPAVLHSSFTVKSWRYNCCITLSLLTAVVLMIGLMSSTVQLL
jgi:hypothetical protein